MLGEADLASSTPGARLGRPRSRAATLRAHPTAATFAALVGLAAASTALRAIVVGHVHGPLVFMDELGYERMA